MVKCDAMLRDVRLGLCLLTRLPLPALREAEFAQAHRAVWSYPLVGLLVGGAVALMAFVLDAAGLPPWGSAGAALGFGMLLTGAMHEDGLADCADGFWGGWTAERRLEIMKDSQIGTYGVLALLLVTGLRWGAMTALVPLGSTTLLLAPILSRAVMPPLMRALPHARRVGLSHSVGRPGWQVAFLAPALAVIAALFAWGSIVWLLAGLCTLIAGTVAAVARRKIGGQTGDVLGAAQQLAEVGVLLALVAATG